MSTKTWDDMRGDMIDSRDVIARLAELDSDAETELTEDGLCTSCGLEDAVDGSLCQDCAAERIILQDFADEQSAPDWQYGEAFIPESQFEDYARQLAEDIGALPSDASWPASYIDWEAAANALRMDYSEVDVDGITYLHRA